MHLQVKTGTGGTGFADNDAEAVSRKYERGTFLDLLKVLREADINIRGASGSRIEFNGTFTFWAGRAEWTDDQNDAETRRAADALNDAGYDARVYEVAHALLDDTPGALEDFIAAINGAGHFVEDILVSTPDANGKIPVQVFTAAT